MFSNTSTLSIVLYGIFIGITIIALFFAFRFIKKENIEAAKLDKMVELFKYAIVTVAIGTVTLIISDSFKEREQDIKELEYFDKYAQDVKKADGITERFQLSKYLSIVAPSGEMKKSWKAYYDTVAVEYKDYRLLKKQEKKLDTIQNPTPKEIQKIQEIKELITVKESPIITAPSIKTTDAKAAASWEKKGFGFLLNKDIDNAITAFRECEQAYNSYHMAYEITNYLVKQRPKLADPSSPEWKNAYRDIAKNFSYKMPPDIKQEFQKK